jgi:hypothetical protein
MRRLAVLIGVALASASAFATGVGAAPDSPVLRSVSASNGHLVVEFTLPRDVVPGRIMAATSRSGLSHLRPSPTVRLREAIHASPDPATGVTRWRTRTTLPPGTYYVEVSGIQTVGITDCMPRRADCASRWSRPRRVVIP